MGNKITGIILAGGKSSRFGGDKAFTTFKGKPLICYGLEVLGKVCSDIIISSNNDQYDHLGYTVVQDEIKGIGPMGGICASLKYSSTPNNLVISCDTPFINQKLINYIVKNIANNQLVVPKTEDEFIEPLCAYYHRDLWIVMEELIHQGNYKLNNLVKLVPTLKLSISKDLEFYHSKLFYNINYPDDLKKISIG